MTSTVIAIENLTGNDHVEIGQIIVDWLGLRTFDNGFIETSVGDFHYSFLLKLIAENIRPLLVGDDIENLNDKAKNHYAQALVELLELPQKTNLRYDVYGGDKTARGVLLTLHYRIKLHLNGESQILSHKHK